MTTASALALSLTPALPLAAALAIAVLGRRLGERSATVANAAVLTSFGLAAVVLARVVADGSASATVGRIEVGGVAATVGLRADPLAAVMLLLVTGVGTVVHLYATRYLQGDPRFARFFAGLGLSVSAVAAMVASASLPQLFVCWVAVGLGLHVLLTHAREIRPPGRAPGGPGAPSSSGMPASWSACSSRCTSSATPTSARWGRRRPAWPAGR